MLTCGKMRGEKVVSSGKTWCCIWIPETDDEDMGICFDFRAEDLDDVAGIIEMLKNTPPEIFEE